MIMKASLMLQIGLKGAMFCAAVVLGLARPLQASSPAPAGAATNAALPPLILSGRQSAPRAVTYSAGVPEILQMLDAGVDAAVILAYIRNSPIAYDPDAASLAALKDHGASAEMLLALMHHGDELRLLPPGTLSAPSVAPASEAAPEAEAAYPESQTTFVPDSAGSTEPLYPTAQFFSYAYVWPGLSWAPVANGRPFSYAPPVDRGKPDGASAGRPALPPPQFGVTPSGSANAVWPALPPPQFGVPSSSAAGAGTRALPGPQFGVARNSGHAGGLAPHSPNAKGGSRSGGRSTGRSR
jgi:hypothetical protein